MDSNVRECPFWTKIIAGVRRRICSLLMQTSNKCGLFSPMKRYTKKRAFPCILKKASITVEAAFMVPLFFMMTICMASIMGIYSNTLERMVSLRDTCEESALIASVSGEEIWVDITLPEDFRPFFLPQQVSAGTVFSRGRVRSWSGRSAEEAQNIAGKNSGVHYVYVAENGSVYHTSSECTHIDLSTHSVSSGLVGNLRNAEGEKYRPCEKCMHGNENCGLVYITQYGDRYHCDPDCSGIKRTVKMVDAATVEGLEECSKCASRTQQS